MRYSARRTAACLSLICALGAVATVTNPTAARDLGSARSDYKNAMQAIQREQWTEYKRLRRSLDDYPLAIYLDYFELTRQVDKVGTEEARRFLRRSADTPLPNRFLSLYLREAGRAQRWQDFLELMPGEPNSIDLKCYYWQAQLAQGNKAAAWEGVRRLWVRGESQPPACDSLSTAWQGSGGLTDEIVWTRLLNAFAARQPQLLQFIAKKGSAQLMPWSEKLLAAYEHPETLADLSLPAESPRSAEIASHGLVNLAVSNPRMALAYWVDYQNRLRFSPEQVRQVEYAIAQQSLFSRITEHNAWLDAALARLSDDGLVGIRLRWALAEQDWEAFEHNLALLSLGARDEKVWRYWQAVLDERRGDSQQANASLQQLASERDYYGFLAADKLDRPYAFNYQRLTMSGASSVAGLPAVARIEELNFHNQGALAQFEWSRVLQDATDLAQQQDLALLATQKGWYRMAIDAATRAASWDALDQRFPAAYLGVFDQHAAAQHVPRTELLAIARRESAFFPGAQSPVGARGLMQIMPATGAMVAASLRPPHAEPDLFDIDQNVLLGSVYYRQLLERFGGNRIYALASYNAGPHRVERWRHTVEERVPLDVWIETIPYLETRNYVQAVLAYNVVYQYLLGDRQMLFTPQEQQAWY